jgi:hypothetical protein
MFATYVYTKFGRSWPHCKKGWTGLVYRLGGRIRPIFGGVILLEIFSMAWKKFESYDRLGCNVMYFYEMQRLTSHLTPESTKY